MCDNHPYLLCPLHICLFALWWFFPINKQTFCPSSSCGWCVSCRHVWLSIHPHSDDQMWNAEHRPTVRHHRPADHAHQQQVAERVRQTASGPSQFSSQHLENDDKGRSKCVGENEPSDPDSERCPLWDFGTEADPADVVTCHAIQSHFGGHLCLLPHLCWLC